MNVYFEGSLFSNYKKKNATRSGIFHATRALLKNLALIDDIEITLFAQRTDLYADIKDFISSECLAGVTIAKNTKLTLYVSSLKKYEDCARQEYRPIRRCLANIAKHIIMLFDRKVDKPEFDIAFFPMSFNGIDQIKAKKNYLLLYDMMPVLFPQNYPDAPWFHEIVSFMSAHVNDKSWHYFAISENTKKDFLNHIPNLPEESITVVPLAANEKFYPEKSIQKLSAAKEKYGIPADKKYMLSLCSLEPRKNIITACRAFCAFIKKHDIEDLVFVLAGGHWDSFLPVLNKEIADMGDYAKNIIQAGYIDDNDMAALYSGAEWFVYTSQYEGFGLPPLEAMQCGTPVITSNNSSLPEVVGNAGIMIDYDSLEQHVKAFEDYYFNSDLKKQNAVKGIERAKTFNWKKSAEIIMEQFKKNIKDWKK